MKSLVLVCGMHRSGTSIVAKSLADIGMDFGANHLNVIKAVNKDGFYEDASVVDINEKILLTNNMHWWSVHGDVDPTSEPCRLLVKEYLSKVASEEFAIKDPRLCLTLPLWLAAANELGIDVYTIWVERAAKNIAMSLYKRDLLPLEVSFALIDKYKASFDKASCEKNHLGVVDYPPSGEAGPESFSEGGLESVDLGGFYPSFLNNYHVDENHGSVDQPTLGVNPFTHAELEQLTQRWLNVNSLIGELELDVQSKRQEWLAERSSHLLGKDQEWYALLEAEITASRSFSEKTINDFTAYRKEAEDFRGNSDAFRREADEFRAEADDFRREADDFRREADDFRREADDFRREADDFRREADDFRREADDFRAQANDYRKKSIIVGLRVKSKLSLLKKIYEKTKRKLQ